MQVIINVQMRNISNCMSLIIVPRHLRDDDDDDHPRAGFRRLAARAG